MYVYTPNLSNSLFSPEQVQVILLLQDSTLLDGPDIRAAKNPPLLDGTDSAHRKGLYISFTYKYIHFYFFILCVYTESLSNSLLCRSGDSAIPGVPKNFTGQVFPVVRSADMHFRPAELDASQGRPSGG